MNKISRLTMAAILVGLLVVVATGVWAAPKFVGPTVPSTVPEPPEEGEDNGGGSGGTTTGGDTGVFIDMGTAVIISDCTDCSVEVEAADPVSLGLEGIGDCSVMDTWCYPVQPEGQAPSTENKILMGDVFNVKIEGTGSVKISFAFPPDFGNKNAKIYKLDTSVNPPVWVEVPGAVVNADGTISVDVTDGGIYALIGDK